MQNDRGVWLAAIGSMQPDGTVLVLPAGHARTVGHDWLFGVRFAMLDEPQCVLYNSASLPALPFELPVPWTRSKAGRVTLAAAPSTGGARPAEIWNRPDANLA